MSRLKASGRRVLDRAAAPYIESVVARLRAESPAGEVRAATLAVAPSEVSAAASSTSAVEPLHVVPSDFFHNLLHTLRTAELERAPKGARTVLSVGCNGRWYFDWFECAVGPVDLHIGIEAYEPMPGDLQPFVRWIPDTADHMDHVPSGSVDLVFAGQTTEHLWASELVGFLIEARRVLAESGVLVLDSPNRRVTQHLAWSHGGHTVELDSDEIRELLELAGFDPEPAVGIWRSALGGEVLALEERLDDPEVLVRRIQGREHVDDSFVWWQVARRSSREPDLPALRSCARALFARHWPARVTRGCAPFASTSFTTDANGPWAFRTLPFPLHAGNWTIGFTSGAGGPDSLDGLRVRVLLPGEVVVFEGTAATATIAGADVVWELPIAAMTFALVIEVSGTGGNGAPIALPLICRPPSGSREWLLDS